MRIRPFHPQREVQPICAQVRSCWNARSQVQRCIERLHVSELLLKRLAPHPGPLPASGAREALHAGAAADRGPDGRGTTGVEFMSDVCAILANDKVRFLTITIHRRATRKSTQSLPAASLRTGYRLPAARVFL